MFTLHQQFNLVILELVIYSELNRQQVLQLLTQTHLTFWINELQLGSIGAELGGTINEFSTDVTMGNDSNSVLTERSC